MLKNRQYKCKCGNVFERLTPDFQKKTQMCYKCSKMAKRYKPGNYTTYPGPG